MNELFHYLVFGGEGPSRNFDMEVGRGGGVSVQHLLNPTDTFITFCPHNPKVGLSCLEMFTEARDLEGLLALGVS